MIHLGIDLGGTAVKAGIVDESYRILSSVSVETGASKGTEHVLSQMILAAEKARDTLSLTWNDIASIGIGSPGLIDSRKGNVIYSSNLNWQNVNVSGFISRKTGKPVFISNDANCALAGEILAGAAKDMQNVVMLTLGTGLGSAVIQSGRIIERSELGHMLLRKDGAICTCGRRGCYEAYVSATGLIRDATGAAAIHETSLLHEVLFRCGRLNAEQIFEAADKQDQIALLVTERYYDNLTDCVSDVINIFWPDKVLLGGGISRRGTRLVSEITKRIPGRITGSAFLETPEISCAKLYNDAGIIGAAFVERFL